MTIPYSVKKSLLGKVSVHYVCPSCKADLEALLDEAGIDDRCPECGHAYVVPGSAQLAEVLNSRRTEAESNKEKRRQIELEREVLQREAKERQATLAKEAEAAEQAKRLATSTPAIFQDSSLPTFLQVVAFFDFMIGIIGILVAFGDEDNRSIGIVIATSCISSGFLLFIFAKIIECLHEMVFHLRNLNRIATDKNVMDNNLLTRPVE